jgi:NAD-dependent dihydropyrimidine dehydrogenase PreA subunit
MGREQREYPVYLIKIEGARCNGCGECADFCPVNVFEVRVGTSFPVRSQNCLGCGTCEAVCKAEAIIVTEI